MSWWTYVVSTSGTDSPKVMQARTQIDGPNFSRWKQGHVPKVEMVAQFARAYDRPVLEAFVAAGYLTAEEARVRPVAAPDFSQLTNDELLELVRERMGAGDGTSTSRVTSMTGSGRSGGREVPLDAAARRTGRASRGQVLRDAQDADAET